MSIQFDEKILFKTTVFTFFLCLTTSFVLTNIFYAILMPLYLLFCFDFDVSHRTERNFFRDVTQPIGNLEF